jgi:hypothetical protein
MLHQSSFKCASPPGLQTMETSAEHITCGVPVVVMDHRFLRGATPSSLPQMPPLGGGHIGGTHSLVRKPSTPVPPSQQRGRVYMTGVKSRPEHAGHPDTPPASRSVPTGLSTVNYQQRVHRRLSSAGRGDIYKSFQKIACCSELEPSDRPREIVWLREMQKQKVPITVGSPATLRGATAPYHSVQGSWRTVFTSSDQPPLDPYASCGNPANCRCRLRRAVRSTPAEDRTCTRPRPPSSKAVSAIARGDPTTRVPVDAWGSASGKGCRSSTLGTCAVGCGGCAGGGH